MKKYLIGIVCLLVATIMIGCTKDEEKVYYTGSVIEIRDGEFDLEYDNNGVVDTMIVISDEKDIKEGDNVTIQTNGTVMLSQPPRVNAINVEVNDMQDETESVKLECQFFERVDDQYIIVSDREVTEGDMIYTYKVDVSDVDKLPDIPFGINMTIEYNGIMTKSNPPILIAQSIDIDFPER